MKYNLLFLIAFSATAPTTTAFGQTLPTPAPPIIGAKSYLMVDNNSGYEIASLNADERLAPASLTKLMSAYAIFRALDEGQISLGDQVVVSEVAWRTPGSRMFIEVGTRVSVQDLFLGMIVQSGNDASVALAEHVAGSEAVFADVMNQYAKTLGMHSSSFRNSTGLPDDNHYSTARDITTLARAIVTEFPKYYEWYSIKEFTYNDIKQNNRNSLLWRDPSVDGIDQAAARRPVGGSAYPRRRPPAPAGGGDGLQPDRVRHRLHAHGDGGPVSAGPRAGVPGARGRGPVRQRGGQPGQ